MKRVISVCILAVCVAMSSSCFATSPAVPEAAAKKAEQVADQAKEMVYEGIVKKHEDGTALITKEKTYPLAGGDFSMVVGKEVSVLGKIVKKGDLEKLVVSRLQLNKQ